MYDKNGNYSIVAKVIFDANMKRLRNGESVHDIARSMHEQVKVLEYNGPLLENGIPIIRYWEIYRRGLKWNPVHQAQQAMKDFSKALYSGTHFPQNSPFELAHAIGKGFMTNGQLPSTTQPIVMRGNMNA